MAADIYYEPGREVETMSEDGNDGTAKLVEQYVGRSGTSGYKNDFTRGRYKVIADVTEATSTRKDKTVKSCFNIAEVATQAQNMALANVALLIAVMNLEGEGTSDMQSYARKQLVQAGVIEPDDEEKAAMEQAAQDAQQQPPDPATQLAAAKTEEALASAGQKKADAVLKVAQATAIGGPERAPDAPTGLEAAHTIAQINKTQADAEHVRTQTQHLPQQLAIEASNAAANRIKAEASRTQSRFSGLAKMFGGKK
jgi:hypothetical protein